MTERRKLPTTRKNWTQKVRIADHVFYLCCGEYEDGSLGEVFLQASKEGTFSRGLWDMLARTASVALQCGVPLAEIVRAWQCMNFPPNGEVHGSPVVKLCTSVGDWLSQELSHVYLTSGLVAVRPGDMVVEKSAGYLSSGTGV